MPSFPTAVWDGDSPNRVSENDFVMTPDPEDWGRCIAEVGAAQEKVGLGSAGETAGTGVIDVTDLSAVYKTVLTLTDLAIAIAEGTTTNQEFGGALVFTFPQGAIVLLGMTLDLVLTSDNYAYNAGDLAVGEAAAVDGASPSGDALTWLTDALATAFVAGAEVSQDQGDIVAIEDGSSTAKKVYLNLYIDDTAGAPGAGEITVNGTITLIWANLGDY